MYKNFNHVHCGITADLTQHAWEETASKICFGGLHCLSVRYGNISTVVELVEIHRQTESLGSGLDFTLDEEPGS